MRLGTRLLRDGVIGLSELEAALRAQVLYGGRLGTNLVELGFLDIDTVGRYLALALGAPEATRERFERTSAEAIDRFGAELAAAQTAFPLGPEPADPRRFAVAVLDPDDDQKRAAIASAIGKEVVLYAAAEMRLYFYLEKHYGIERQARYVRATSTPREPGKVERRRVLDTGAAPRVIIEPRRSRSGRVSRPAAAPAPEIRELDPLLAEIAGARHRDHIGAALIAYAPGRLDAMAVLLIRDRMAVGWRSYSARDPDGVASDQLSLPLSEMSALKLAFDANETYWGPPPEKTGVDERLWRAVGLAALPQRVLVAPIAVRDRVVNLVAASGDLDAATRREIAALAAACSETYLRMIRGFKSHK